MQSVDPDNFFEAHATKSERARKAAKSDNKHGNPLCMKAKILAAVRDPSSPDHSVFIAEATGMVKRIGLASEQPKKTYYGPKAPVTSLAVGDRGNSTLFAGCWDKDVWSWDIMSGRQGQKFSGHSDFVKTVICTTLSGKPILISGGADKKILVWDIESGKRLHTLQDASTTMLAVQHLAVDPVLSTEDAVVFASASSDPYIRRWKISLQSFEQLAESYHDRPDAERLTIEEHETSVYKLLYDDTDEDGDLWTASADGTAKLLTRSRNFVTEDVFEHGNYVRAVVVTEQWVITAGRDENVKVWNRSSGKLSYTLEGHFEEVTDLILLKNQQGVAEKVCSVSIDKTIRTWPLAKVALDQAVAEMRAPPTVAAEEDSSNLLTAEEEAELAELMDD